MKDFVALLVIAALMAAQIGQPAAIIGAVGFCAGVLAGLIIHKNPPASP